MFVLLSGVRHVSIIIGNSEMKDTLNTNVARCSPDMCDKGVKMQDHDSKIRTRTSGRTETMTNIFTPKTKNDAERRCCFKAQNI